MTKTLDLTKENDFGVGCWNADKQQWEIYVKSTVKAIPTSARIRDERNGSYWNAYLHTAKQIKETDGWILIYKDY